MRQLIITKQITDRNNNTLSRYFQDINKYDLLSAEEEVKLTIRIKKEDDQAAFEKLITSNLRFVVSVAKQYQNRGLNLTDLINEGNVGLVKAAHKYDETRGFKFISYAVWWIRQSIIQALAEQTRTVRLPLNKIASIHKISRVVPFIEQELEREPTEEEIAQYLDITTDEVTSSNSVGKFQLSFDAPISNPSGDETTLYDIFFTNETPQPDEELLNESLKDDINRALIKLSRRETEIITMAFGLNNSRIHTLYEISDKLGLTTERIRQIRQHIINKLKTTIRTEEI